MKRRALECRWHPIPSRDLAAFLIVTALLILALVLGREVLTPLALATILAFILAPVVRFLIDHHAPRALAVGCVTIAFVASIIASPIFFGAQLRALTASLANYKENLVQKLDTVTKSGSGDSVIGRAVASIKFVDKALRADTRRSAPGGPNRPVIVAEHTLVCLSGADASLSFKDCVSGAHAAVRGSDVVQTVNRHGVTTPIGEGSRT